MKTKKKVQGVKVFTTGKQAAVSLSEVKEAAGIYDGLPVERDRMRVRLARVREQIHARQCEQAEYRMHMLISKHHG